MSKRAVLYLSIFSLLRLNLFSQEIVTGLQNNPLLKENETTRAVTKAIGSDTLTLPFFDDFSGKSFLPDAGRWDDDNVFINNTYSDKQITSGIATFDAIDNRGRLYETTTPAGFTADQLTSKPFNLAYPASANIWLSFLYEAGGLSDKPEPADSLALYFYSPADSIWYSVWRTGGSEQSGFRNVIIPITNSRWLKKGFRFRFVNYASLGGNLIDPSMAGNCDIWNLDYIILDINRGPDDTVYNDVAFRLPVRSLLKRYEAMPWKQFRQVYLQEMGSSIPVHYRNNDVIVRNVTRNFEIWDVYKGRQAHSFSAGATNVQPGSDVDYNANLIYTFNTDNPDSALFRITCSLKTDEFDPKSNDTITYDQVFSNYFAYDDGSSEAGYGINGQGSRNAMFAYRFTSFMPDTLRAVAICFNDSYLDENKRAFDLQIREDNNGTPGELIYSREDLIVENGSRLNGFYYYHIPEKVVINGTFYVGWKQRSETFLNAGLDINTPHKGKQFFWLNGSWSQSQVEGSVMIRPVLGLPVLTGINDDVHIGQDLVSIWPNPARDQITIGIKEYPYSSSAYVCIIDLAGHELMKVPFSETIDISGLKEGMYIVVTVINGRKTGYSRLIKSR